MTLQAKAKKLVTSAAHEALAKTFGPKILNRLKGDSSYDILKHEIDKEPGKDLAEKVVSHIISKAPHEKYKRWMAQSYANGGINKLDDVDKTAHALSVFHKYVAKLPNKDIGAYKGFHDLSKAVEPFEGVKSKSEENREKTANMFKNGEATLVHDSPKYRVVIPQTEEASKHFGKNTKWCTAAENSRNYFKDYKPKGNLFYLLDKKANKRHALFVPHKAFDGGNFRAMEGYDEQDAPVTPRKIMEMHPEAVNDVIKHVPNIEHHSALGRYDDPSSPDYDSSAAEIERRVLKHVRST
jgi:hypothetical protein